MNETLMLIEAERAIVRAIVVMTRAFDDGDWQTVRKYLGGDCRLGNNMPPIPQVEMIRGPDKMIAAMKENLAKREAANTKFAHAFGDIVVTVLSDNVAEASAFQFTYVHRAQAISSLVSQAGSRGKYELIKEDGDWKIASFTITRLWLEGEPY